MTINLPIAKFNCPYCGVLNKIHPKGISSGTQIAVCDNEVGGCDRYLVLDVTIKVETKVAPIGEFESKPAPLARSIARASRGVPCPSCGGKDHFISGLCRACDYTEADRDSCTCRFWNPNPQDHDIDCPVRVLAIKKTAIQLAKDDLDEVMVCDCHPNGYLPSDKHSLSCVMYKTCTYKYYHAKAKDHEEGCPMAMEPDRPIATNAPPRSIGSLAKSVDDMTWCTCTLREEGWAHEEDCPKYVPF